MFRPSLRSIWSLIGLAALALVLYFISQSSYTTVQDPIKLAAAQKMQQCMDVLKQEAQDRGYVIDENNDPNLTGLIGVMRDSSNITTSYGTLSQRLTSLNPNMAGLMIEFLREAGVDSLDMVAVGMTGANPGANLALYAAMETMKLRPVIITSVGSAEFGANRDDFTWLDMEHLLYRKGMITFRSRLASLGGYKDRGGGVGKHGRKVIRDAIIRNGLNPDELWVPRGSEESVAEKRWDAYQRFLPPRDKYVAFINIGGGYGNVGVLENAKIIRNGVNPSLVKLEFEEPGVMMQFAETMPVIHLYDIAKLAERYDLPIDPEPLPQVGSGSIFESKRRNVTVAAIALAVILLALILVVFFDRKDRHFTQNVVNAEDDL